MLLVPLAIMALVAVLVLINSSLDEDRKRKRSTLKTAKGKKDKMIIDAKYKFVYLFSFLD